MLHDTRKSSGGSNEIQLLVPKFSSSRVYTLRSAQVFAAQIAMSGATRLLPSSDLTYRVNLALNFLLFIA